MTRAPQGTFAIGCADGRNVEVDDLVFASSGPATLPLLQGLPETAPQQTALASMDFRDAVLALHTDPTYAPANPVFRSFFNAGVHGNYCEASMWLKNVLAVPPAKTAAKVWKSWIMYAEQSPANVLAQARYKHMLPTPATLKAQNQLLALQGHGDVWFVGGYTRPYDSQETAFGFRRRRGAKPAVEVTRRPAGRSNDSALRGFKSPHRQNAARSAARESDFPTDDTGG